MSDSKAGWEVVVSEPGEVKIDRDLVRIYNFQFTGNGVEMPPDAPIMQGQRLAAVNWAINRLVSAMYEEGGKEIILELAAHLLNSLHGSIGGEPCGFVYEDVVMHREAAHICIIAGQTIGPGSLHDWHISMANRIEELLPPEDTGEQT